MSLRVRAIVAVVAVSSVLLTACVGAPQTPDRSGTPSASPSPLFASEQDAVEAADAVIQEYWAATNTVFQAGGEGVELLRPLVTEERMESELVGVEIFQRGEFKQVGDYTIDTTQFQQMYESGGLTRLVVTTCVDYSAVRAFNPAGQEAIRKNAAPRFLHQVTLAAVTTSAEHKLRLDDSEPWPDSTC